jgi:hypothetical protein
VLSYRPMKKPALKRIFISYAHEDRDLAEQVSAALPRELPNCRVEVWSDREIRAGQPWLEEIQRQLEHADVVVLLVSAHYASSEFVASEELPKVMSRYLSRGALLWIPVDDAGNAWADSNSLSKLQAVGDRRVLRSMDPLDVQAALKRTYKEVFQKLDPEGYAVSSNLDPKYTSKDKWGLVERGKSTGRWTAISGGRWRYASRRDAGLRGFGPIEVHDEAQRASCDRNDLWCMPRAARATSFASTRMEDCWPIVSQRPTKKRAEVSRVARFASSCSASLVPCRRCRRQATSRCRSNQERSSWIARERISLLLRACPGGVETCEIISRSRVNRPQRTALTSPPSSCRDERFLSTKPTNISSAYSRGMQ